MLKILKNELNISIITSIMFILLGIIILANPGIALYSIGITLAVFSIIIGIVVIIINLANIREEHSLLFGVLTLLMGIILIMNPESFGILVALEVGIWFIVSSVMRIKLSAILKDVEGFNWVLILVCGILTMLLGVVFIFMPTISAIAITEAVGVLMIAYSIIDIIEVIEIKKHIKEIDKALNN